ncbi:hypothetical protein PIB30_053900 [Stylosanthes scabra]|uniref:Uncharacterized protein n=1 Tax=Stylosanthes scabra TaxID=79078 RepID=A0ABU6WH77_9FABA|nr:hypothetical protein [Stylosanthes scabra]
MEKLAALSVSKQLDGNGEGIKEKDIERNNEKNIKVDKEETETRKGETREDAEQQKMDNAAPGLPNNEGKVITNRGEGEKKKESRKWKKQARTNTNQGDQKRENTQIGEKRKQTGMENTTMEESAPPTKKMIARDESGTAEAAGQPCRTL